MVTANQVSSADGALQRRVVLLGASNLTRGMSTVLDTCAVQCGSSLDVLAALGHGRSYGNRSAVFCRSLPSILDCELWTALADRPRLPTTALVTDIGNDLLYEAPVERIADWVMRCLDKLLAIDARIVMTRLPVGNIDQLPEWKFRLLRRLMFPLGRISYATLAERARQLDQRLASAARDRGITLIEQCGEWYGFDPIHLKPSRWRDAWGEILSPWSEPTGENGAAPHRDSLARGDNLLRRLYLVTRTPDRRWWLGIEQRGRQPCARLPDGTQISLY